MKKLFVILTVLFFFAGISMAGPPTPPPPAKGLKTYTVATLPAAASNLNLAVIVTDSDGVGDCTVGGQSNKTVCISDGTNWVATGDGTGGDGSGSVTTVQSGDVQVGGADIVTLDFAAADFAVTETPDTEINVSLDVVPSSGNSTIIVEEDAVQVKYDSTLTEGTSGLGIAADAIDETKIADDGIDSEHYNDGSIDAVHLAADVIDETKIADDGIDSEHYNADSIDNEHINWTDIDNLGDEGVIVAADESADTTTFVGFFTDATGSAAKTGTNLTFNSSTGELTATGFTGALTGNADTVTVADAGGDTTTWPLLSVDATGSESPRTDATLTYQATTGILTATGFAGNLTGNADTVTTNANLTGEVTSVGNAATIADSVAVSSWNLTTPTVTSGAVFTGADASPDADGELVYDTIVTGLDDGALAYFGGADTVYYVLASDVLPVTNDHVLAYNSGTDRLYWKADADSGGAPALSAVTAPTAAWGIAFDDEEKVTWTTSQATAGSFLTITNPVDPVAAQLYLLDLTYSVDDGQALADYIIAKDAGGTVFTLEQNGDITSTGGIDLTGTTEITLANDETITNAVNGVVKVTGILETSGNIELGDISANTLSAAAGVLSIEGSVVHHTGGTDITDADIADDLTIASTKKISTLLETEQFRLSFDADDYMTATVDLNGATTIATVDSDGAAGNLILSPDGTISATVATDVDAAFTATSVVADGNVAGATYGSDSSISDAELLTLDNGAATEILVGGGAGSAPVWTTATGTGAPMRGTSPTITTGIIITGADHNPASAGEIRYDSTITGIMSGGALRWYDDNSVRMIVDLETDPSDNGYVVAYNSTNDGFEMVAAGAGDVLADGTVPFTGEVHFENNAAAATFGLVTTDADVVVAFDAVTAQGSITYMEGI
jgi:hypothetical protein